MADITKCMGKRVDAAGTESICQLRETCYRYKADSSQGWQAYFIAPIKLDVDHEGKHVCQMEWRM